VPELFLIGISPGGQPTPEGRAALARVGCVVTAPRHAGLVSGSPCQVLPISPLAKALDHIEARLGDQDVAVLASGDPLFFGIGRSLIARFGAQRLTIHPAVSSMQLAFARLKEPWQDAAFISLHGREEQDLLPKLLARRKLFLFTDPCQRPEIIAARLATGLAALGMDDQDCQIMVAEELGSEGERISHGTPAEIAGQRFADLNVMIVLLAAPAGPGPDFAFGLTEAEIAHSRGLITKDEVRAAIIHQLRLPPRGVLWDIGAGSGSIGIEAARVCPGLTVYAIERHSDEQANIIANRKAFRLANLHLVPGQAPEALSGLPAPDRVVIGGSGGELPAIVATVTARLAPHGIVIASAVLEATREAAPRLFHQHGLRVAMTTIAVSRESYPPSADGPRSLNPITIITGST